MLGAIATNAQPVITADGVNPVIGEIFNFQETKTFSTPLTLSNFAGANKVWDFSRLADISSVFIVSFISPKGLLGSDSFPNSNIALILNSDSSYIEYGQTDSSGWWIIGDITSFSIQGQIDSIHTYTPRCPYLTTPSTYGTYYTDSVNVYNGYLTTKLYDTLIGVGYGTLKLPNNGTYNNVLCLYENDGNGGSGYVFVANGYHVPLLLIISTNVNNNNWFARYYAGQTLPLEINSFSATWRNKKPYLQWNASNTENIKAFNIQRSMDCINFNTFGQVSVSSSATYKFEDSCTPNENVYYRIQQLGKDGKSFYSNIARLTVADKQFIIFPNPAKEYTNISFDRTVENALIKVYDIKGKQVINEHLNGSTNAYKLNTQSLKSGVYLLKVNSKTGNFNGQLFINK